MDDMYVVDPTTMQALLLFVSDYRAFTQDRKELHDLMGRLLLVLAEWHRVKEKFSADVTALQARLEHLEQRTQPTTRRTQAALLPSNDVTKTRKM